MSGEQLLSFIIDHKVSIVSPKGPKDYWTLGVGSLTIKGQYIILDGNVTSDQVRQGLCDLWRKAVDVGIVVVPISEHGKQQK